METKTKARTVRVERFVGPEAQLLKELRRNLRLLPKFAGLSGEGVLRSDIERGTKALLAGKGEEMESALRVLQGNKHWQPNAELGVKSDA